MGLFRKKSDAISERSRQLKTEISSLETQIRDLEGKIQHVQSQPKFRSTAWPERGKPAAAGRTREPIFEAMEPQPPADSESTPAHFNDLGVRKYDLVALWKRLQKHFRGPPVTNPKLVSYLAAGSIKGLRPLRYEKRVARNRFLALFAALLLILWGVVRMFFRH